MNLNSDGTYHLEPLLLHPRIEETPSWTDCLLSSEDEIPSLQPNEADRPLVARYNRLRTPAREASEMYPLSSIFPHSQF